MRFVVFAALVALGCSSKDRGSADRDKPAAEPGKRAPAPSPSKTPPSDRCETGDKAACRAAGALDAACLHGDAAACAEHAAAAGDEAARWRQRACQRGHQGACRADRAPLQLKLASSITGVIGLRVASVYRHAIADCYAETAGDRSPVAVALTFAADGQAAVETESDNAELASCAKASAARWRFPGNKTPGVKHRFELSLAPSK